MKTHKIYLDYALELIFRNDDDVGFWDDESGRIIESIYHDTNWKWMKKKENKNRYSLFCLSMILLSKKLYNINLDIYEEKIKRNLKWVIQNYDSFSYTDLTYGAILSIVLGKMLYNIDSGSFDVEKKIIDAIENADKTFDNQNSLILISAYYNYENCPSEKLFRCIKNLAEFYIISYNKKGYFGTGDFKACYHQRIMYVLWGLIFTSRIYKKEKINNIVNDCLLKVWENNRDNKMDNAFLWHPGKYFIKYKYNKLPVFILNYKSAKYLFECHQTFFYNAVTFYQIFYQNSLLSNEKMKALDWIYGDNRIGKNLCDITGLNIPCRIMTKDGDLFVVNEMYKGSYEIGSYILALSSIVCKS